jgi:hypothetical protein
MESEARTGTTVSRPSGKKVQKNGDETLHTRLANLPISRAQLARCRGGGILSVDPEYTVKVVEPERVKLYLGTRVQNTFTKLRDGEKMPQ